MKWGEANPEKHRECKKKWAEENPEKVKEKDRIRVEKLSDSYIAVRLGLPVGAVTKELFEMKREQLTLYRMAKEIRRTIKQGESNETVTNARMS